MNIVQSTKNTDAQQPAAVKDPGVANVQNVQKNVVNEIASLEIKNSDVVQYNKPSADAVAKAAKDIQNFVKDMGRNLSFSVDEVTGYNVVRVVNPETNELIRQLPSEELLKIARSMKDLGNVLVNQKA
jgi:flagellar protein FlaG